MVDDTGGVIKSHTLGLRIQKKVLGKMASRSIARHFIDDEAGKILDTLYAFLKDTLPDAEAKKVIKAVIKTIIKLGILYHNDQLSATEKQTLKQMVKRFSRLIMTIVTFWEVAFSYDEVHVRQQFSEVEESVVAVIKPHLTAKSEKKVRFVFATLTDNKVLTALFQPAENQTRHLDRLAPMLRDYMFGEKQ